MPPVLFKVIVGLEEGGVVRRHGMVVLPLGKQDLPQRPAVDYPFHLDVEEHLGIILRQEIDRAALLRRPDQLDALRHGAVGDAFAEHMDAALQAFNGIRRVFMKEIGQNDRVHVLLDELLEAVAVNDPLAVSVFGVLKPVRTVIADRRERTALKEEIPGQPQSASRAHNADFQCSHDRFLSLNPQDDRMASAPSRSRGICTNPL